LLKIKQQEAAILFDTQTGKALPHY